MVSRCGLIVSPVFLGRLLWVGCFGSVVVGRLLEVDYCESVSVGCCRLVGLCRSLWDVCGETGTKGRSLLIGRFVSVGSLPVSLLSVTMDWSLWGGRCELVAVGLSRWEDGWMPCVGRCGSIAMSIICCCGSVIGRARRRELRLRSAANYLNPWAGPY